MLTSASNFVRYLWSTGSTEAAIQVSDPGNYSLTVTDKQGCTGEASFEVIRPGLPEARIESAELVCGAMTDLSGNLPAETRGRWETTSSALIEDAEAPITVVSDLPEGTSSFYWTLSTDDCPDNKLLVYNRWGDLVFEQTKLGQ